MTENETRLKCLELANERATMPDDIVRLAHKYSEYVFANEAREDAELPASKS